MRVSIIYRKQPPKLGVFSHSLSFGAGRSSQNTDSQCSQVPRKRFLCSSQASIPSKVPKSRRFPTKVPKPGSQAKFGRGSQEQFLSKNKQGSRKRI